MEKTAFLWCPVRKKYVADRPEERIRLRVIAYLEARQYPLSAMQVEYKVGQAGRFDLAVFTRGGDIWLLVECKQAPLHKAHTDVALEAQVQLRRYARELAKRWKVHYLGIVIGDKLYWFDYIAGQWLQELPPYPAL